MLIFQDSIPDVVGPVRSARQYYIAWAAEWTRALRPRRRLAPGDRDAAREGQRPARLQRRRVPLGRHLLPPVTERFAPHNVYTKGKDAAQARQAGRREGQAVQGGLAVRAGRAARRTADGGTITVAYPANMIKYRYDRKTNTYLRSVSGETKQIDAADGKRVAPKNVVVMMMSVRAAQRRQPNKHRLEATVIGSGTAWIATNGKTIKGTWRKTGLTEADPVLRRERASEVTLTVGQTFVQVMRDRDSRSRSRTARCRAAHGRPDRRRPPAERSTRGSVRRSAPMPTSA